jgi:hypothetical protein
MGSNPFNLFIRFVLELGALFALGYWGWRSTSGPLRYLLGIGIPILAALVWGIFAVPDDPSRSGKAPVPIPGTLRLVLELLIFGAGCWAVYDMGFQALGWIAGFIVLVHYGVSYDRIKWLLRQ